MKALRLGQSFRTEEVDALDAILSLLRRRGDARQIARSPTGRRLAAKARLLARAIEARREAVSDA